MTVCLPIISINNNKYMINDIFNKIIVDTIHFNYSNYLYFSLFLYALYLLLCITY